MMPELKSAAKRRLKDGNDTLKSRRMLENKRKYPSDSKYRNNSEKEDMPPTKISTAKRRKKSLPMNEMRNSKYVPGFRI